MRKKQKYFYSGISIILVFLIIAMFYIIFTNKKTVAALDISSVMKMDAYSSLDKIDNVDLDTLIEWSYNSALESLKSNGIKLSSIEQESLKTEIQNKIRSLYDRGMIEFDDTGALTTLSKAYLSNIGAESLASIKPEAAVTQVISNYTEVFDPSELQAQIDTNRENLTKLASSVNKLGKKTNVDVDLNKLEETYAAVETLLAVASNVPDEKINNKEVIKSKNIVSKPTTNNGSTVNNSAVQDSQNVGTNITDPTVETPQNIEESTSLSLADLDLSEYDYSATIATISSTLTAVDETQKNLLSDYQTQINDIISKLSTMSAVDESSDLNIASVQEQLQIAIASMGEADTTLTDTLEALKAQVASDYELSESARNELQDKLDEYKTETDDKASAQYDEILNMINDLSGNTSDNAAQQYADLITRIESDASLSEAERQSLKESLESQVTDLANDTTENFELVNNTIGETNEALEAAVEALEAADSQLEEDFNTNLADVQSDLQQKIDDLTATELSDITALTATSQNIVDQLQLYQQKVDSHAKVDTIYGVTLGVTVPWTQNENGIYQAVIQSDYFKGCTAAQVYYNEMYNFSPAYEVDTSTGELTVISTTNPQAIIDYILVFHIEDENTTEDIVIENNSSNSSNIQVPSGQAVNNGGIVRNE